MKLLADIRIPAPPRPLRYGDRVLLTGSCFTANVGAMLAAHKFGVLANPTGILFDPRSVCRHLGDWMTGRTYRAEELTEQQGVFHSWQHHSDFSGLSPETVVAKINASVTAARGFLAQADHLIITLGSAFSYELLPNGRPVANCHQAPGTLFRKHLCPADAIEAELTESLAALKAVRPSLQVIFTISPVRHLRDGVVENNRSKAQLIEAVHRLCAASDHVYYFPAYELVIDVLRDYRWYDSDLAHPNYAATRFVFEKFCEACIDPASRGLMEDVKQVISAMQHKARFPGSEAHRNFMAQSLLRVRELQEKLPALDWTEELAYFSGK